MTKLRVLLLTLASACLFLLCGCSMLSIDGVEELMSPPKYEGENYQIEAAFESVVGSTYVLKAPRSGEYRSAYVMYDLNGDGEDEAIVFYAQAQAAEYARINIVHNTSDGWLSVCDIQGQAKQADCVLFSDLDADGNSEIVVGWNNPEGNQNRRMCVYRYSDDEGLSTAADLLYTAFEVIDVDADGREDILLLSSDEENMTGGQFARFISTDRTGELSIRSEFGLDERICAFASVMTDYETDISCPRIYIDGIDSNGSYLTQLIKWTDEGFAELDAGLPDVSLRSLHVCCEDNNGDGIIEIPTQLAVAGSSVIVDNKVQDGVSVNMVVWKSKSDEGFVNEDYGIYNAEDEYILQIPSDWTEKVTAVSDRDSSTLKLYAYDGTELGKNATPLFVIKTVKLGEQDSYNSYYSELMKTDRYCYMYKISSEGKEFGVTEDALEQYLLPVIYIN